MTTNILTLLPLAARKGVVCLPEWLGRIRPPFAEKEHWRDSRRGSWIEDDAAAQLALAGALKVMAEDGWAVHRDRDGQWWMWRSELGFDKFSATSHTHAVALAFDRWLDGKADKEGTQ